MVFNGCYRIQHEDVSQSGTCFRARKTWVPGAIVLRRLTLVCRWLCAGCILFTILPVRQLTNYYFAHCMYLCHPRMTKRKRFMTRALITQGGGAPFMCNSRFFPARTARSCYVLLLLAATFTTYGDYSVGIIFKCWTSLVLYRAVLECSSTWRAGITYECSTSRCCTVLCRNSC